MRKALVVQSFQGFPRGILLQACELWHAGKGSATVLQHQSRVTAVLHQKRSFGMCLPCKSSSSP